jgi:hypothetical protein
MRGLRTSIDHLRVTDASLAQNFAAVTLELEAIATSISPGLQMNSLGFSDGNETNPFGHVVAKQQQLLDGICKTLNGKLSRLEHQWIPWSAIESAGAQLSQLERN